jgi:plastocyanin
MSGMRDMTPGASSSAMSASGNRTPVPAATITIKSYQYSGPGMVTPGARITIRNQDPVAHTVTADGKGDFDVMVGANATTTFTAPQGPGSYPFHCTYHANMHGTLKVG